MIKSKMKISFVSLGARIPADLKMVIAEHCQRTGVKLQFFVTEALMEKLEDAHDAAVVKERSKEPALTSKEFLQKYIQNRKKNS